MFIVLFLGLIVENGYGWCEFREYPHINLYAYILSMFITSYRCRLPTASSPMSFACLVFFRSVDTHEGQSHG